MDEKSGITRLKCSLKLYIRIFLYIHKKLLLKSKSLKSSESKQIHDALYQNTDHRVSENERFSVSFTHFMLKSLFSELCVKSHSSDCEEYDNLTDLFKKIRFDKMTTDKFKEKLLGILDSLSAKIKKSKKIKEIEYKIRELIKKLDSGPEDKIDEIAKQLRELINEYKKNCLDESERAGLDKLLNELFSKGEGIMDQTLAGKPRSRSSVNIQANLQAIEEANLQTNIYNVVTGALVAIATTARGEKSETINTVIKPETEQREADATRLSAVAAALVAITTTARGEQNEVINPETQAKDDEAKRLSTAALALVAVTSALAEKTNERTIQGGKQAEEKAAEEKAAEAAKAKAAEDAAKALEAARLEAARQKTAEEEAEAAKAEKEAKEALEAERLKAEAARLEAEKEAEAARLKAKEEAKEEAKEKRRLEAVYIKIMNAIAHDQQLIRLTEEKSNDIIKNEIVADTIQPKTLKPETFKKFKLIKPKIIYDLLTSTDTKLTEFIKAALDIKPEAIGVDKKTEEGIPARIENMKAALRGILFYRLIENVIYFINESTHKAIDFNKIIEKIEKLEELKELKELMKLKVTFNYKTDYIKEIYKMILNDLDNSNKPNFLTKTINIDKKNELLREIQDRIKKLPEFTEPDVTKPVSGGNKSKSKLKKYARKSNSTRKKH